MATRTGQIKPKTGSAAANTMTPRFIGDLYILIDGETKDAYIAVGLTSSDWIKLN